MMSHLEKFINLLESFGLKKGTNVIAGSVFGGDFAIDPDRDDKTRQTVVLGSGKGFAEHCVDFDFQDGKFLHHGVRS